MILEAWKNFSESVTIDIMVDLSFVASHIWVLVDEICDIIMLLLETKYRSPIVIEKEESEEVIILTKKNRLRRKNQRS